MRNSDDSHVGFNTFIEFVIIRRKNSLLLLIKLDFVWGSLFE